MPLGVLPLREKLIPNPLKLHRQKQNKKVKTNCTFKRNRLLHNLEERNFKTPDFPSSWFVAWAGGESPQCPGGTLSREWLIPMHCGRNCSLVPAHAQVAILIPEQNSKLTGVEAGPPPTTGATDTHTSPGAQAL